MHGNILGAKYCNPVQRTRKIGYGFAVKSCYQVNVYIEPVLSRKRVLVEKVPRGVSSADFNQRFVVQRLRIYANTRRAHILYCAQLFVGYGVRSACLYRKFNVPKRKTVE